MNQSLGNYQNYFRNANQNVPNPMCNMNFNKCNYTPEEKPSNLYEAYDGFIRGNMFPDLYNIWNPEEPYALNPMTEQEQALIYVDALAFAMHDLNLYLDNFPRDREMIELYNQYREEEKRVMEQYENAFGPLVVTSKRTAQDPWAWINEPWPWEQ